MIGREQISLEIIKRYLLWWSSTVHFLNDMVHISCCWSWFHQLKFSPWTISLVTSLKKVFCGWCLCLKKCPDYLVQFSIIFNSFFCDICWNLKKFYYVVKNQFFCFFSIQIEVFLYPYCNFRDTESLMAISAWIKLKFSKRTRICSHSLEIIPCLVTILITAI